MEQDFIVGVIGDFSGAGQEAPDRFAEVDRDTFFERFEALAPRLSVGLPFCEELTLASYDDWHPDALIERVPMLGRLLEAREAAGDPARMRELLGEAGVSLDEAAPSTPAPPPAAAVSEAELLDDLLSGPSGGSEPRAPVRVAPHRADPAFEQLLAEIAAPHAERIDHAGIARRRDAIDGELGARTRSLLRHPSTRRCEALWRSLRDLVFGSDTGESLRIRMLDARAESLRDPASGLADRLHRLVVVDEHGTPGGQPFGLLLVDAELQGSDADLTLLASLGRIAGEAEVPCLVGAGAALWSAENEDAARAFLERARAVPGASRLALCAPRLLARLPFGRDGDPVERFAFEEVDEATGAEGYCWGPGGFAVAQAAADAVAEWGGAVHAARCVHREGLPFHPRGTGGEPVGPTEQVLPDSELTRLRELGLLPVAGVRGRDAAVLTSLDGLTGEPLF